MLMRLIFLIFTLVAVLYGQQADSAVPILKAITAQELQ
jgi:hypothetical protein